MLYEGPWHRLDREPPGARQLAEGPVAHAAGERLERKALDTREFWEPRLPERSGALRTNRAAIRPGPYAPQLIRLVRTPYVQSTAWARRQPYRDAAVQQREERPSVRDLVKQALDDRPRPSLPRPERPLPGLRERRPWTLLDEEG